MTATLGVAVVTVAVLMTTLVASLAVTVFAVPTITRIERDNFLGGCRLGHDRRHTTTQVGHHRCRLAGSGKLDHQWRIGRVKGGRPGDVAIACRSSDDE